MYICSGSRKTRWTAEKLDCLAEKLDCLAAQPQRLDASKGRAWWGGSEFEVIKYCGDGIRVFWWSSNLAYSRRKYLTQYLDNSCPRAQGLQYYFQDTWQRNGYTLMIVALIRRS